MRASRTNICRFPAARSHRSQENHQGVSGERSAASPLRNLLAISRTLSWNRTGRKRRASLVAMTMARSGNIAATRKIARAPMNTKVPIKATAWILPTRPEWDVKRVSSDRLRKTKTASPPRQRRAPQSSSPAGGDRHAFIALEHHRPQYLTGARRVDIIPHITDTNDGKHFAGGDRLYRA